MDEGYSNGSTMKKLSITVIIFSILWAFFRPDLWALALGFAVFTIILLSIAYDAGVRQRRKKEVTAKEEPQCVEKSEGKTEAEIRFKLFQDTLAEAELFKYELAHGLVPDGYTDENPGYGPMDFNEWRQWKHQKFEQTGNLWHNHPDGLRPNSKDERQ
jgi:hypothetical protein